MSNTNNSNKRKPDALKITTWNANSITDKRIELIQFLQDTKTDILLAQETFLKPQRDFKIPNYKIYRSDRLTGRAGGTAILIKKNIMHNHLPNIATEHIENTSIKITTSDNSSITITSVYLSPAKPLTTEDLNLISQHQSKHSKLIVGGDLNARHFSWHGNSTNLRGRTLHQHQDLNGYAIAAPIDPTHYPGCGTPSVIDIYLIKNITTTYNVHTIEQLSSDHYPVILTTDNWQNHNTTNSHKITNWNKFKENLMSSNLQPPEISNAEQIENEAIRITKQIQEASNKATSYTNKPAYQQQLPADTIQLIKQKNKAYKLARRTLFPPHQQEANRLNNLVKAKINDFRNEQWALLLTQLDDEDSNRNIWSTLNMIKNNKTNKRNYPIQSPTGLVYTAEEKANTLADSLQARFSPNDIPPPPNHNPPNPRNSKPIP